MNRYVQVTLLALAASHLGCLPADTRPEPGRVFATTKLSSDLDSNDLSFVTDDGWTVTVNQLFVSFGSLQLDGKSCNSYSEARYQRIVNLREPGAQKVAQVWGLNDCLLTFAVVIPDVDSVLGSGVSNSERMLMAKASVPVSSETGVTTSEGMALHLEGHVEKDGARVGFDWGFADFVRLSDCKRRIDGKLEEQLPLKGGETIGVSLGVEPRNLFMARSPNEPGTMTSPAGPLSVAEGATSLVQSIFEADQKNGNANGRVDLDELTKTSVPGFRDNLAEVLRKLSYPSVFLYDEGGQCNINADVRGFERF
jgi:hypothetical protein